MLVWAEMKQKIGTFNYKSNYMYPDKNTFTRTSIGGKKEKRKEKCTLTLKNIHNKIMYSNIQVLTESYYFKLSK